MPQHLLWPVEATEIHYSHMDESNRAMTGLTSHDLKDEEGAKRGTVSLKTSTLVMMNPDTTCLLRAA